MTNIDLLLYKKQIIGKVNRGFRMNTSNLKKKTISGVFWIFLELIFSQGAKFFVQIILARLLLPEDFGIIGMTTIFISISQAILDSGLQNALIRENETRFEDYSTVFLFNLISSCLLYGVLFFSSPIIAAFYNVPKLVGILRVLGTVVIINSFGLVQRTQLTKQLNFKIQTKIAIISTLLSGAVAIALAYLNYGVWSLVVLNILGQLGQSILLCLYNRWSPSLIFNKSSFKRLFTFGWKVSLYSMIYTLYDNFYYVVIGKFYSTTSLGYYTNVQKFRDVASQTLIKSVQRVSYPALSSLQKDSVSLKEAYKKLVKYSIFFTFPIMFGLSGCGAQIIILFFGEKWTNATPYFQILCLAGVLYPLHSINLNMLKVKGRSDLLLKLELLKKAIGLCLISLVIITRRPLIWLVGLTIIDSVVGFFINTYFSADVIKYFTKEQLSDIFPAFISSSVVGIVVFYLGQKISWLPLELLLLQIFVGSVIYIILSLMLQRKTFFEIIKIILTFVPKKEVENE